MSKQILFFVTLVLCFLSSVQVTAQDYKFGIRAGLNYSQFLGPEESATTHSDEFSINNGIHFGVTFAYHLTDNFGFRTELAYNQIGTKYKFESEDAPYVFRNQFERETRNGHIVRTFDINNSYIHFPLMVFVKPFKKLELFGGIYTQYLVLPTVGGIIDFTAPDPIDPTEEKLRYSFIQSVEGNYYSDEARGFTSNQSLTVELIIEGEEELLLMPRVVGSYYELDADEKDGSTYNWFDAGVEVGGSYFINNSLYFGVTAMYGLFDVSNNSLDVDYFRLDEFEKYQFRDDFDRNFSLQFSLGFKF